MLSASRHCRFASKTPGNSFSPSAPPLRARILHRMEAPPPARGSTEASSTALTPGQILRGHGPGGWQEAGWDFGKSLSPKLQQVLLNYAQMSQAAYDQLCSDRCQKRFGQVDLDNPTQVIDYLTTNYPLKPDQSVAAVHPGTADLYDLPDGTKFHDLPPIIHALPGTMPEDPQQRVQRRMRFAFVTSFLDGLIKTVTGLLVTFVDGSNGGRQLFTSDPVTGRGRVPPKNGTFMGYITVSKPATPGGEVDVAIAWRGTIFKEEWESNFGHDELTTWYTSPEDKSRRCLQCDTDPTAGVTTPRPWQVGVHDGFDDLYNRPIEQLNGDFISPRQLLRKWLPLLMKEYNVATITMTGHSLGGALSTLSAYGAAELLDNKWDSWQKDDWATKEKPKITVMNFASPRVGNYAFGQQLGAWGVRVLRVVNIGDAVPTVPGFFVQIMTRIIEWVPFIGKSSAANSDSFLAQAAMMFYSAVAAVVGLVPFPIFRSLDRWGYFHVGQEVQLLPEKAGKTIIEPSVAQKHNMELYLHLLSLLGEKGWQPSSSRNNLLLNKSDDLLADKTFPADWWHIAGNRGYVLLPDGRWDFEAPRPVVPASAGASNGKTTNGSA